MGRRRVVVVGGGNAGLCAALSVRESSEDVLVLDRNSVTSVIGRREGTMDEVASELDADYDVLVVGAGSAALASALSAHEQGASVLVLEKAPHSERGGNGRFSGGMFRFVYDGPEQIQALLPSVDPKGISADPYSADDYVADSLRVTDGRADPVLTKVLVENSYAGMLWLQSMGVQWEPFITGVHTHVVDGVMHFARGTVIRARGKGAGLVDFLFRAVEARGIPVVYDAAVTALVNEDAGVQGVVVQVGATERVLRARAVILAAGGYQANRDMRRERMGEPWATVKVRGSRFDTGEIIGAAMAAGAQEFGDRGGCHATPIDIDAPAYGDLSRTDMTNRLSYPYGVMVNVDGHRFVDEGSDFYSHTYAKTGRSVLAQPGGRAYQIFDQRTAPLLEVRYSTSEPVVGGSYGELAERIGVPGERLTATLESFNAAVSDTEFDPGTLDGKSTIGISPVKSNWAVPIDSPPYLAYEVTCGITFTFGGIRIDQEARVVGVGDVPIPGLFAAGEITGGFFYGNYVAGAGLMRGAVFGRIAGRNAARLAGATVRP